MIDHVKLDVAGERALAERLWRAWQLRSHIRSSAATVEWRHRPGRLVHVASPYRPRAANSSVTSLNPFSRTSLAEIWSPRSRMRATSRACAIAAGAHSPACRGISPRSTQRRDVAGVLAVSRATCAAVGGRGGTGEALRTTAGPRSRRLRALGPAASVGGARLRTGGASRVASHPLFDLVGDAYASCVALSTRLNLPAAAQRLQPAHTSRCGYSARTTSRYCA